MTINKIASTIAKAEGLKSQVGMGNVRELVRIMSDMLYAETDGEPVIYNALLEAGKKRAKKKKAKR